MKYATFLCLFLLFGCNGAKNKSSKAMAENVTMVRSFVFINSDSLDYYNNKLKSFADISDPHQNAVVQYCDGLYYMTAGIHNKAITNFNNAAQFFAKENNDSLLAYCQMALGNCFKLNGNEDEAIGNYLKALPYFEKTNNYKLISSCNANLSETYLQKNDIIKAKDYLSKAKQNQSENSRLYIALLHFEANLLGQENNTDSALYIDRQGIALALKNNFPEKLSPFYDNMAHCHTILKNYDSATWFYKKCIYLDSTSGRLQLMADSYAEMVNIYGLINNEEKMKATALHAIKLCDSTQYLRGKYILYQGFNNYYTGTKNWYKLVEVKDSLQEIYKRLTSEETEAKIAEYNVGYETAKKEKLILEQKSNLQKVTYLSIFTGLVAMLLAISIFAIYKYYKTTKTIAVNEAIQKQNNIKVQAVFESEQAERIRIARDLHDSIGQKLSVLKMYLHNKDNNETKSPALLDETIQEVRNISHNLLPEELNFGLLNAIKSDLEKLKNAGNLTITSTIQENDYSVIPLSASLNILRVFRELLSNLVKHSAATALDCSLYIESNHFHLILKDNGKGIDKKAIERSSGIGWKNIFARINMLNGKIDIKANEPQGSDIHITTPIALWKKQMFYW